MNFYADSRFYLLKSSSENVLKRDLEHKKTAVKAVNNSL